MPSRHAICLVIDGLRASAIGTYGNTSSATPHFDALAARSLVFDWLWSDGTSLDEFYRSVWLGKHALRPVEATNEASLICTLNQAQVRQCLFTDEPWLAEHSENLPLDDTLLLPLDAKHSARELEETTLANYFVAAIEHLHWWREQNPNDNSLLWLHCRGLAGTWDAPLELRDQLLDEDDPAASEFIQPPAELRDVDDPDQLLAYRVAYAAQIAVLDACVGALVQSLDDAFAGTDTLLSVTSSRGFPLGEHGAVGLDCRELFSERLHLPWLLYPCGNGTPLPRSSSLVQPADMYATLGHWFSPALSDTKCDGLSALPTLLEGKGVARQVAVAHGEKGEFAIRTPAWMLRQHDDGGQQSCALFTKPDDRWEFNDVSSLCPEVIEGLQQELATFQQCCQQGKPLPACPQDQDLLQPQR